MPLPIESSRLDGILAFLQAAERLKDTLRSSSTRSGRQESTAEHSWRLCLMAMLFEREMPGIDLLKLLKLCIVHDLGEAISGDVPAVDQAMDDGREERERRDFVSLCSPLADDLKTELIALWDEYAAAKTAEAHLAKGFDKLETMLQHQLTPPGSGIDHPFNLHYGRNATDRTSLTRQIRETVDARTREIIAAGSR